MSQKQDKPIGQQGKQSQERITSQDSSQLTNRTSQGSSDSNRTFVDKTSQEIRGPKRQAHRDTPPSSQQFASWTPEQRKEYKAEVIKDATKRIEEDLDSLRKDVEWYKAHYEEEVRRRMAPRCSTCDSSSASGSCSTCSQSTFSGASSIVPVRVAAIRRMERSGSLDTESSRSSSALTRNTSSQGYLD